MQRTMTIVDFHRFVRGAEVAVIHFDAPWDAQLREPTRVEMRKAKELLGDRVAFAEVDVDVSVDVARAVPIASIPAVAYYRDGKLMDVIVGAGQDVSSLARSVLAGEPIGRQIPRPAILRRIGRAFQTTWKYHWRRRLMKRTDSIV